MKNQGIFILSAIVAVGFAALGWMALDARRKLARVFGAASPSGDAAHDIIRRLMHIEARMEEAGPRLETLEDAARTSIQKVGFLRFKALQDTGGDNSFVLVLLDSENSGVLLYSLYMRTGTRIYARAIDRGAARQPLSEEEQKVLDEAMQKKMT